MKTVRPLVQLQAKAPTGITGLDEITGGGLPRGRTTLLVGGPGSGKTILALQFLVHGAEVCREPGIFVAFEETSKRILANAESFGWKLADLQRKKLFLLDAQPTPDLVQSGNFDLSGMIAALDAQATEMKAQRIVFDALDIVLALLPDPAAKRREVYRLHEWLLARELTGLITAKAGGVRRTPIAISHSASCSSWWIAVSSSITASFWAFRSEIFAYRSIAAPVSMRMNRRS
jgi:circadian clock protein KaiC